MSVTKIMETIDTMMVISVFAATLRAWSSVSLRNYADITFPCDLSLFWQALIRK